MSYLYKKFGMRANFLAFPSIQVRYAVLVAFLFFIQGFTMWFLQHSERKRLIQIYGPDIVLQSTSYFQFLIMASGTLLSFIVILSILHRFLGPIFPIIKYFEEIKRGNRQAILQSRKEDGLTPLVDYLKSIEIDVRDKK